MKENEPIQHSSISSAIKKLQKRFETPLSSFINAASQEEWIRKYSTNA